MKIRAAATLLCVCVGLGLGVQARCATLPDACGDDKIQFNVKTAKDQPVPARPGEGKAQIVFVEAYDKGACAGCGIPTTRIGMDATWAGATRGNSYFAIDVAPGEHHLCASWQSMNGGFRASKVAVNSFSAEAGKVYYFAVEIKSTPGAVYGAPNGAVHSSPNLSIDLKQISDDEGKYRVKISPLASATRKN